MKPVTEDRWALHKNVHNLSSQFIFRACNFRYIAVQWDKPTTYGDALVTGYKVYVNGIVEAVLNADQLTYTYTQGKWCHEYAFQVQVSNTNKIKFSNILSSNRLNISKRLQDFVHKII